MPDLFLIRPATPSDSEGIAKVHTRSWQSAYRGIISDEWLDNLKWQDRKERWDRQLPPKAFRSILVAVNPDDEIVGFVSIGPTRDEDLDPDKFLELYAIYLSPELFGAGVGSTLLREVMKEIPVQFRYFTLWVLKENARGRGFYESRGFVHDGATKMAEIGNFELGEIRYRLELPASRAK